MIMLLRYIIRLYNFENAETTANFDVQLTVMNIFMLMGLKLYFESTRTNVIASWIFIMLYSVGETINLGHFNFETVGESFISIGRLIIEILMISTLVKLN